MVKECMECKRRLRGRVDKKFCTDICRNSYNNKVNSDVTNYMRTVNSKLRRNRRILEELFSLSNAVASRSRLLQKGFDLSFFTHTGKTNDGHAYFCYDYGYLPISEEKFFLVREDHPTPY